MMRGFNILKIIYFFFLQREVHVAEKLSRVMGGLPMGITLPETSQSFLQGPELFSFAW